MLLSFPAPTAIFVYRREDGQRAGDTYLMSILKTVVLLLKSGLINLLTLSVLLACQISQSDLHLCVSLLKSSVVLLELDVKLIQLLSSRSSFRQLLSH